MISRTFFVSDLAPPVPAPEPSLPPLRRSSERQHAVDGGEQLLLYLGGVDLLAPGRAHHADAGPAADP